MIGITAPASPGIATGRPSTADSTLIAGVMMPSPRRSPAPTISAHRSMRGAALLAVVQEPVEREHAALAVVLRAQHQDRVFDRDDQRQRPDRERDAAEHVVGRARRAAKNN